MSNVVSLPIKKLRKEVKLHIKLDKPLNIPMPDPERGRTIAKWRTLAVRCRLTYRKVAYSILAVRSRYLLGKLVSLSLKLNRKDFHIDIKYDGYDHFFYCNVYCGGEKGGTEPSMSFKGINPAQDYRYALHPNKVKEAITAIKAMSKHNKLMQPIFSA